MQRRAQALRRHHSVPYPRRSSAINVGRHAFKPSGSSSPFEARLCCDADRPLQISPKFIFDMTYCARVLRCFVALGATMLTATGCDNSSPPSPAPPPATTLKLSDAALPPDSARVPYGLPLHHIDVGDIDGDGLADLILASHVANRVDAYFQHPQRNFSWGSSLDSAGYHPNGTLFLASGGGTPYVLLNAETKNAVQFYRLAADARLDVVGAIDAPAPALSAVAQSPSGAFALAVAGKSGDNLHIFNPVDPGSLDDVKPEIVQLATRPGRRVSGLVAANLDHEATPSFVATLQQEGRVIRITASRSGASDVGDIWSTDRRTAADFVLPVDFDGDGDDDLFVLGQQLPDALLLLNDGLKGFRERRFNLETPGARSGAVISEADGSVMLWAAMASTITVFRWESGGRESSPKRVVINRAGRDWLRFAVADLDADGHSDLVLGSSVGMVPPTAIFGPLFDKLESIGAWLSGVGLEKSETAPEPLGNGIETTPPPPSR